MKCLKIGAVVLNQTPLDWSNNRINIEDSIKEAQKLNIEVLCLPELCLTGYGCEDAFHADYVFEKAWENLQAIVPQTKNIVVALGLPLCYANRLYNVIAFLADQRIHGFVAKQFLANDGIHYESRWFTPWRAKERTIYKGLEGETYPLGDMVFDVDGVKIGFEICEDAWVAKRPATLFDEVGIDLILNPSASHFSFDKPNFRYQYILDSSRRFQCTYLYTNLLGNESGRIIYDGSIVMAQSGQFINITKPFSFNAYRLTSVVIDLQASRLRQRIIHTNSTQNGTSLIQNVNFSFSCSKEPITPPFIFPKPMSKEESFLRAITLGLFDYMRKSYTRGFVISLSGGMDSSAVLCICYFMILLAVDELGLEGFKNKLSYFTKIRKYDKISSLFKELIMAIYQATNQSSRTTLQAAKELANSLNVDFHHINIENICQDYIKNAETLLNYHLNWTDDDVALQNIQARVRSPQIWLIANLKNSLLLTTSNRSEIAVGYCTMDGDTSGGLAPIGGIDKNFLKQWLNWLQVESISPNYRLPILKLITQQSPTAELRPLTENQTDEQDLMPYELLNQIERLAILEKKTPLACFEILKENYDITVLRTGIKKFFRFWARSQWKRERYALSFHVDDRNLDPRSWCRFPILSGGFEEELSVL